MGLDVLDPSDRLDALDGRGALREDPTLASGSLQRQQLAGTATRTNLTDPFGV